jgi:hypothetical protein
MLCHPAHIFKCFFPELIQLPLLQFLEICFDAALQMKEMLGGEGISSDNRKDDSHCTLGEMHASLLPGAAWETVDWKLMCALCS